MSSHNNIPPDKNTNPFAKSDIITRSPPTMSGKRLLSELSPSSLSPVEKRHQPTRDDPLSPVISLLDTSRASDDPCNYYELVREASSYLAKINEFANDTVSRRNNLTNKTEIMNMTQKLTTIISLLALKNSSLENKVANIERDLISAKNASHAAQSAPAAQNASYADALKLKLAKSVPPVETRKPLPCVIAYPTHEKSAELKSSSETKQALMKAINPSDGFQIHGVKKTANSGVILRLTNESQIKKLKSVDALKSAGLRLETPKGRSPRILIKDVPQHISDENFILALYNQNIKGEINVSEDEFKSTTKIIRRRLLNNNSNRKWIGLELQPKIRKHLIETKEKLFIDWAMCRFVDDVELVRCLNCQQFGHTAKFCRESDPCCRHCANKHKSSDCPNKDMKDFKPVCGSCFRYKKPSDHPTGSSDCPTYKTKMEQLILTTHYE